MISPAFRAQVELLLGILPEIAREGISALKGGTAINLFVREIPRISVDIDLTYLPFHQRAEALKEIAAGLQRIKGRLDSVFGISMQVVAHGRGEEARLTCRRENAAVKVEVNTVMRGHLWPVRQLQLAKAAQNEFSMFAVATVVSDAELYGGKICAALDRQHPRDLFDVQQLFDHDGLSEDVRLGFLVSLLSVKKGNPDWSLFPVEGIQDLPAVKWKLVNIETLKRDANRHREQLRALEAALSG